VETREPIVVFDAAKLAGDSSSRATRVVAALLISCCLIGGYLWWTMVAAEVRGPVSTNDIGDRWEESGNRFMFFMIGMAALFFAGAGLAIWHCYRDSKALEQARKNVSFVEPEVFSQSGQATTETFDVFGGNAQATSNDIRAMEVAPPAFQTGTPEES
jgi:hypothetical protein